MSFYENTQFPEDDFEIAPQPEVNRLSGRGRGLILFFSALGVLIAALSMCMVLMLRSADVEPLPAVQNIRPLEYVVNMQQPTNIVVPQELKAPESKNDSELLNFLFIAVEGDRAESFILTSVNMRTKQVAMVSMPRDTYVSGSYDDPRLGSVYSAASDSDRGIQAVREKAKEMIGFWPDYYLVLDKTSLMQMFEFTGNLEFTVPEGLEYTEAEAGTQYIDGVTALELFGCIDHYNTVETDSAQVQRELLQTILRAVIAQEAQIRDNAVALKSAMYTDLTVDELAYMAYFLHGLDLSSVAGFTLPGEIIETEDGTYFQVEPFEAVDLLNRYFNPLEEELTIFDVNFRQLAGDSGVGQWEEFGFDNNDSVGSTTNTEKPTEDETEEPTDGSETTKPTEPTQPPAPTETTAPPTAPPDPEPDPGDE